MRCPYKGLVPFSEEDQEFFAGRAKEIDLVVSNLYASSLTILYGESGVGKTSLIVAGVLPELGKDEHRVAAILFREWQSPDFELKLRREILNSLLKTINRLRQQSDPHSPPLLFDSFLETFRSGLKLATVEQLYALSLDEFIKRCCQAFYGRLFFIFDQFEEYIYYHPLSEDGKHFDEQLAAAINDRSVPAGFLVSLREDGLGKLDRLRGGIPDLLGNVIRLEHLDKNGAEEAIRKPLRIFNRDSPVKVEVTDDFTATLLNQADADRLEWDEPAPPYVVAALFQSLLFVHEKMGVVIGRAFERGRRFVPILVVKDQDALRARAHEQNALSGLAEGQRLSRQEDHVLPVGNVDHRQQQVVGRHIQMAQQEIFHDGVIASAHRAQGWICMVGLAHRGERLVEVRRSSQSPLPSRRVSAGVAKRSSIP